MDDLHFGYADAVSTPRESLLLGGFADRIESGIGSSGVMDDLYVRALCLKLGDVPVIVATVDLLFMSQPDAFEMRARISTKLGIPVEHVMLCLSHTHSAPLALKHLLKDYEGDRSVIEKKIDAYLADLSERLVTVCHQACKSASPARLYSATYRTYLGFNRRYVVPDESGRPQVQMLFGDWRKTGLEPNGVVDPDIPILMIERAGEAGCRDYFAGSGVQRVVLFNVAIHPVILGSHNRYVSADYPGAARRCIENALGHGTKAMFLLGACGDVNPAFAAQRNPAAVEVFGNAVGSGVVATLANRRPVDAGRLDVGVEKLALAKEAELDGITVQVFRIGDAAVVAVTSECFTQLGMEIRTCGGLKQILVATNSNGGHGYIPTKEAWEIGGGYALPIARRVGFDQGLLDRIVDTAAGLLNGSA